MKQALLTLLVLVAVAALAVGVVRKSDPAPEWVPVEQTPDAGSDWEANEPPEVPFDRRTPFEDEEAQRKAAANAKLEMQGLLLLSDEEMMTTVTQRLLQKRAEVGLEGLNPTEQNVLRSEAVGIRIAHEGLAGWWLSPWSDDFDKNEAALKATGATVLLPILEKTLSAWPGGIAPTDLEARQKTLELLTVDGITPFYELDQEAVKLLPKHADAVAKYVRAHWEELRLPPAQ
ncbi:MAG: hypothetical protein ACJ790_17770 [Myxococcaceae bacterium]